MIKYDLELFRELNESYVDRPLVPRPRTFTSTAQTEQGNSRAAAMRKRYGISGLRTLEIGCGRGEVTYAMAHEYGCDATGVDIVEYPTWAERKSDKVKLTAIDISREDYSPLGQYDFIYSYAVWEHIHHPFAALKAAYNLLRPGGTMYLCANLYRGPKASHRYREIFFPWPHLLFTDEVFGEYYRQKYGKPKYPAWVNKLITAEYFHYFSEIGFQVDKVWFNKTPIDEPFYERFEEILGRYPRYDLERDFIHVDLRRPD